MKLQGVIKTLFRDIGITTLDTTEDTTNANRRTPVRHDFERALTCLHATLQKIYALARKVTA